MPLIWKKALLIADFYVEWLRDLLSIPQQKLKPLNEFFSECKEDAFQVFASHLV